MTEEDMNVVAVCDNPNCKVCRVEALAKIAVEFSVGNEQPEAWLYLLIWTAAYYSGRFGVEGSEIATMMRQPYNEGKQARLNKETEAARTATKH